jgi:hypothetical protein
MITALEIVGGLMLTCTLATALGVLTAFELGRMITASEERRVRASAHHA